jgi:hypothetical protein
MLFHISHRHKPTIAIVAVTLFFFLSFLFFAHPLKPLSILTGKGFRNSEPTPSEPDLRVCRHVAVASYVGWHFEIYMSIVAVLEKELCPFPTGSVHVYLPESFRYGFDNLVDELGLYHGNFSTKHELFDDMDSASLFPEDEGSMIDMIVLPSCEWDLKEWHDRLLQSWRARPMDKKFQVVCMFHHGDDMRWSDNLVEWVRTGDVRLLTISEHVSNRLRRNFRALAESNVEAYNSAGYEYVKMDVYLPILDLPLTPKTISTSLSDVAIIGSFRFERRDYLGVYADLITSFEEDPRAWGYLPLSISDQVYQVDNSSSLQPFQLHLIGNAGDPQVPASLSNVVRIHSDLDYDDYFSLINSMDLAIPAWSTLEYYEAKASFTMAISIECNVPVLVNEWIREAYAFLDDDVTVTRPHAVREIFAVKALRTGQWSPRPGITNQVADVKTAVDEMIKKGWIRSAEQFARFKNGSWAKNTNVVRRILNDI